MTLAVRIGVAVELESAKRALLRRRPLELQERRDVAAPHVVTGRAGLRRVDRAGVRGAPGPQSANLRCSLPARVDDHSAGAGVVASDGAYRRLLPQR